MYLNVSSHHLVTVFDVPKAKRIYLPHVFDNHPRDVLRVLQEALLGIESIGYSVKQGHNKERRQCHAPSSHDEQLASHLQAV